MSVYILSTRMSSVENSIDELARKADSFNAVLSGTTTINGPALLNGPVTLGSSITGIDVVDVAGLQKRSRSQGYKRESGFHWNCNGYI